MWPFPADITYLWTVLAIISWRNLKKKNNISRILFDWAARKF